MRGVGSFSVAVFSIMASFFSAGNGAMRERRVLSRSRPDTPSLM
jgi:hypothetical protein